MRTILNKGFTPNLRNFRALRKVVICRGFLAPYETFPAMEPYGYVGDGTA
jgi:hypothetical protein